jgi:hypothetical protein
VWIDSTNEEIKLRQLRKRESIKSDAIALAIDEKVYF